MWAITARTQGSIKEIEDDDKNQRKERKVNNYRSKNKEAEMSMNTFFPSPGCLPLALLNPTIQVTN